MEQSGQARVLDAADGRVLLRGRVDRRRDAPEERAVRQVEQLGGELNAERRADGRGLGGLGLDGRVGDERREGLVQSQS